ncbi:MAG: chitobiase/beta-hexosaminidase C-terminal domain-containing protein, partial [Muribaculaceae bacterium]|nr:chitobiase/beta-hexosaminidase C-terminal domain-containing protein [Muribaculaceae bacterium]
MKKLLLATALFVGSMSMSAQNAADFNTLTANSGYNSVNTTAQWQLVNCAVVKVKDGGKDYMAPTLNGKTTAVGTVTSPVLKGGVGTLSFNYSNTFKDTSVKLEIDIKQNDKIVKTQTLSKTGVTQNGIYSFTSDDFNVEGDFTIFITNLSPSNSEKNADRTSIYNLTWTSFDQASAPKVAKPTITMVEGDYGYTIEMACETEGASIHYTVDGTEPTAESSVYNAPLNIWEKTTVKAIAVKDGEKSNVSTFEANPPMILDGFDALLGADPGMVGEGINVVVKAPMTVLYVKGSNAMVR